jgi:hypothetical protein
MANVYFVLAVIKNIATGGNNMHKLSHPYSLLVNEISFKWHKTSLYNVGYSLH